MSPGARVCGSASPACNARGSASAPDGPRSGRVKTAASIPADHRWRGPVHEAFAAIEAGRCDQRSGASSGPLLDSGRCHAAASHRAHAPGGRPFIAMPLPSAERRLGGTRSRGPDEQSHLTNSRRQPVHRYHDHHRRRADHRGRRVLRRRRHIWPRSGPRAGSARGRSHPRPRDPALIARRSRASIDEAAASGADTPRQGAFRSEPVADDRRQVVTRSATACRRRSAARLSTTVQPASGLRSRRRRSERVSSSSTATIEAAHHRAQLSTDPAVAQRRSPKQSDLSRQRYRPEQQSVRPALGDHRQRSAGGLQSRTQQSSAANDGLFHYRLQNAGTIIRNDDRRRRCQPRSNV